MAVHQSVRGRASQISKFLEHNARVQQGSPLEIQVSFQEHGGKPVDAGRAEVSVLAPGLVDGDIVLAYY